MLKITVEGQSEHPKILLDGKLVGDWVNALQTVWESLPVKDVTLNLSGVTFVDAEGKKLLSSMLGRGARLEEPQLLVKYIVDEIKASRSERQME